MIKKIIINKKLLKNPALDHSIWVDPLNTEKIIKSLQKHPLTTPLCIYDITYNPNQKNNDIIKVSDHHNKTGHNPLIGNQQKFSRPFIDISTLYNERGGTTTTCLGKNFNQHKKNYPYPSTYLCYISIIARALNKKNIHGFLVNTL